MTLIAQLNALQPDLKLLIPGAFVHCSLLSRQLNTTDQEQAPLNIGWRIIDRSYTAASPDCVVVTDASTNEESSQLLPISQIVSNTHHNLKELCVNTGDYELTGIEQVTVLLEIDTGS